MSGLCCYNNSPLACSAKQRHDAWLGSKVLACDRGFFDGAEAKPRSSYVKWGKDRIHKCVGSTTNASEGSTCQMSPGMSMEFSAWHYQT